MCQDTLRVKMLSFAVIVYCIPAVNKIYFKTFISEKVVNIYSPETNQATCARQIVYF